MTKTQWAVIGVLATGVVIVFCLTGLLVVMSIPNIIPPQAPIPEIPTSVAPAPVATATSNPGQAACVQAFKKLVPPG